MRVKFLGSGDVSRREPERLGQPVAGPSRLPSLEVHPHETLTPDALRRRENAENFPVALRILPTAVRHDLRAIYAVARTIDELGDAAPGDRDVALTEFRTDLQRIWRGSTPQLPVLQALVPTVWARGLTSEPFDRLIEANLVDQVVSHYATFDELIGYCKLSADPVGRLVLDVFGQRSPATTELSDRVCRALQLLEHWQDVAEDRRAGRVYLPQEDLTAFGVVEADLDRRWATEAVRELMMFEIRRAAELLESGAPLVGRLTGWARVAVAGHVAGGRAAAHGLRRTGGDVLGRTATTRGRDVAFSAAGLLLRAPAERTGR
jgi:squalene synthase HpnC